MKAKVKSKNTDGSSTGSKGRRFIHAKPTVTTTHSDIGDHQVEIRKSLLINGFNDSKLEFWDDEDGVGTSQRPSLTNQTKM